MKLTDWIPGDVKPVREGVYERMYPTRTKFCRFHCGVWLWNDSTVIGAARQQDASFQQDLPWRGLAEQPK